MESKKKEKIFNNLEEYAKCYYGKNYWKVFLNNVKTEDILKYLKEREGCFDMKSYRDKVLSSPESIKAYLKRIGADKLKIGGKNCIL